MKENTIIKNLDRLLEYLLYSFVFLLPWQARWIIYDPKINGEVWEYGRISIYAFDIVFLILLNCYIVKLFKNNYKLQVTSYKLLIPVITLLLYYFITILFLADHKILSLYWSLRILEGIGLVWILYKINFSKVKLALAFVVSVALSAILGIYQFLTQSAFANKWLGLAYHSASVLGDSVVETVGGRWLRAYGSMPHPNVLAGFLVVAIILCLWLLDKSLKHESIKALKQEEIKKLRVLNLFLYSSIPLFLITALFFTFSRAAWLIFFITLLLYYFITKDIGVKKKLFLYFYIFIFLSIIFWPLVQTRLQMNERLEVKSNVERLAGYSQAWQIIKQHPVLGVGLGNYTVELQKTNPSQPGWAYQPVHNVFLLVMSELGILGVLIAILCLSAFACFHLYQPSGPLATADKLSNFLSRDDQGGKTDNELRVFYSNKSLMPARRSPIGLLGAKAGLMVLIFLMFFDHFWWTLPSGLLLWWMGLGLVNRGLTTFFFSVK